MHHAQRDHDVKKDREISALEEQHIGRLIGHIRRLIRVHEQHACNDGRRDVSVLLGEKTVQHRKKQEHPHHYDHQLPRKHPVLDHLQNWKQDQIGGSHKQNRAVAHPRRKELAALKLFQRQLYIERAVGMKKGLCK